MMTTDTALQIAISALAHQHEEDAANAITTLQALRNIRGAVMFDRRGADRLTDVLDMLRTDPQ